MLGGSSKSQAAPRGEPRRRSEGKPSGSIHGRKLEAAGDRTRDKAITYRQGVHTKRKIAYSVGWRPFLRESQRQDWKRARLPKSSEQGWVPTAEWSRAETELWAMGGGWEGPRWTCSGQLGPISVLRASVSTSFSRVTWNHDVIVSAAQRKATRLGWFVHRHVLRLNCLFPFPFTQFLFYWGEAACQAYGVILPRGMSPTLGSSQRKSHRLCLKLFQRSWASAVVWESIM